MDELVIADVNADMGDAGQGVGGGEEHQVTGLQIGQLDLLAVFPLLSGSTADGVSEAVVVQIVHQAGAVKAVAGMLGAPPVAVAQLFLGLFHQLQGGGGDLLHIVIGPGLDVVVYPIVHTQKFLILGGAQGS